MRKWTLVQASTAKPHRCPWPSHFRSLFMRRKGIVISCNECGQHWVRVSYNIGETAWTWKKCSPLVAHKETT